MSEMQDLEVVINNSDAEGLEKLMSKVIAEIIINRIDKLPDEIKGYVYKEVKRVLDNN